MDKIISLIESLQKGGKPAQPGEIRVHGGVQYQKMGNGEWKVYTHPEEKQLEAEQNKNKVVSLTDKLKNTIAEKKEVSASEQHLSDLKNQKVVPDKKTRSEKPMFTDVDAALAHGYSATDFREVGNFFYDRAQKMAETISKLEQTKQKVDPNFEKIKKINLQMAKQFISQGNRVDDRQAKTKAAMKKSVIHMGHNDAASVDTAKFAVEQAASQAQGWWLETIHNIMEGYQYGDVPRVITMDQGDLYLVKVDDGLYSGIFKKMTPVEDGILEDNAKVRLERMTLATLVQFCLAKEWMKPVDKVEPAVEAIENLTLALEAPVNPVEPVSYPTLEMDRKIRFMELLDKLMS